MTPAAAADAAAVVELWQACGLTRPWNDPHADFSRALVSDAAAILIMRSAQKVVASIMVGDDGHRGWVYYLAVSPDHRGGGLGRSAMAAAESWLRGRGCPKIQLMVREDNDAALSFYEAIGLERQSVVTLGKFLT